MRELFVYYRVRSQHADAALRSVRGLQASMMAEHPALIARLLRRAEPVDGSQTWMETYAVDPATAPNGIGPELQVAIELRAAPLLPLLEGTRHTEVFIAFAS